MPAIGKDLSKIRSHLGLSIQDIQHETKIPVDTLKKIEDGSIFDHPEENQTYIRSFVRSYGRALKIDTDAMIKALDQNEDGNYNHLLLEEYPELNPDLSKEDYEDQEDTETETVRDTDETEDPQLFDEENSDNDAEKESSEIKRIVIEDDPTESSEVDESKSNEENTGTSKKKILETHDTEKSVKSVDWADVGRRFNQEKKGTPLWIIGFIIILIVAAVAGYFLYENGFFSSLETNEEPQQEQVSSSTNMNEGSLSLDLADSTIASDAQESSEPTTGPEQAAELGEILELTVYAAFDGLGPVRVWSDIKPRMDPYWLEQGTVMKFEFEDTIRVRGSYSDLLLFKDGHLIENAAQEFLNQNEDYIQLTRDFFMSDPKWTQSVDYELPEGVAPPDSIAIRPTF